MQITKLELTGFKSFVEHTELAIAPGLTGVIGPNGCGKSNLLEALRWVMGETSVKSMRGGAMDDVIFAGTDHRPARNHASVGLTVERDPATPLPRTLTLVADGLEAQQPAPPDQADLSAAMAEFVITRKISRGDGSAYAINGRDVRARDIRLLFEDAATGARSHALVRQGQIGEIIRAKPEQRRRILEDAAGIAGLHARRHEAELKLNATSANMERVQDVADQLEAQRNALQRQARQARKYRELAESIAAHEAFALHLDWLVVGLTLTAREHALRAVLTTLAGLEADFGSAERAVQARREQLQPAREQEMTRAAVHQRLTLEVEATTREIEQAKRRQGAMRQQRATLAGDLESEAERLQLARETAERCGAELTETRTRLASHADDLSKAQVVSNTARERSGTAQRAAHDAGSALAKVQAEGNALAQQITSAETSAEAAKERVARCQKGVAQIADTVATALTARAAAEDALARCQSTEGELEVVTKHARAETDAAQNLAQAAEERATQASRALDRIDVEIATLAKLTGPAPTVSENGGGKRGQQCEKVAPAIGPSLIDLLTVRPGFERAVAGALRGALRAPVRCVPGSSALALQDSETHVWTVAMDRAAFAAACDAYRQSGQPARWDDTPPATLACAICAPAPLMAGLGGALERFRPVSAPPTPQDLSALPAGWAFVGDDGTVWWATGYVATDGDSTADAARLSERNRLLELRKQLPSIRADAEHATSAFDEARTTLKVAQAALADAQAQLDNARNETRSAQEDLARTAAAVASAERERALLTQQLDEASALAHEQSARADEARVHRAELPSTQHLEAELAELRAEAATALAAQSSADAALQTVRARADELHARAQRLEKDAANAAAQERAAAGHRQTLEQRAAKLDADIERIAALPDELTVKLATLKEGADRAARELSEARDALAKLETELRTFDSAFADLSGKVSDARELKARREAELAASRQARADVQARIAQELDCLPDACLERAGPLSAQLTSDLLEDSDQLTTLTERTMAQLHRLRSDRDRMGAVNLQADKDLEALEDERARLIAELEDLQIAIEKLRRGITALNKDARSRLLDAFQAVNAHFGQLFQTLFGGGHAELKLVENDDPLQAGLELIARPPGKKPATLSLLSGGEQALTAMALIFGVFLTNPSPICVLDEVDAPLDDANVERFATLLEWMRRNTDTRFLVITHHPMTMSRVDRLFGVTMSEKGVSKLVSVDLLEAKQALQLAS